MTSLLALWLCTAGAGPDGEVATPTADTAVVRAPDAAPEQLEALDREVTDLTQKLGDWSEQARLIDGVLSNLWEKNGWTSEADQFARQTVSRISKIPPWQFKDRMDTLLQVAGQRYRLDDQQKQRFQQKLYEEMWSTTLKYGPSMFKTAKDALSTRVKGEAFTPQQVARWATDFEPMMEPWRQDTVRMMDEFGAMLTPEQREVFEKDTESLNKRMDYVVRSSKAWKNGAWRPEDWGLQDDPVHQAAYPQRVGPGAATAVRGARPDDESTWARYVQHFIKTYQLDEPQQQACSAVLEDMVTRAGRYRTAHTDEIAKLTPLQGLVHPLLQPIRSMFAELKARLETLPTEEQRRRAGE